MATYLPNGGFWAVFRSASVSTKASLLISSWFFCGLLPGAPGTFGTAAAIIPAALMGMLPITYRILIVAMTVGIAITSSSKASRALGRRDPSQVVIDEVAGYLVAVFALPVSFMSLGLGFILFRVFDILKPFPIGLIDKKVRGGLGIVLDDLLAGAFAFIGVKAIFFLLP